jgi:hypothetical protein
MCKTVLLLSTSLLSVFNAMDEVLNVILTVRLNFIPQNVC